MPRTRPPSRRSRSGGAARTCRQPRAPSRPQAIMANCRPPTTPGAFMPRLLCALFLASQLLLPSALARDGPLVPTPERVVEGMLELVKIGPKDVVYDLGSGDGRIVIAAAKKHGARGVGIDIDPQRVKEARDNARRAGVADRVEFREGDLFKADISEASVVTIYLLSSVNL